MSKLSKSVESEERNVYRNEQEMNTEMKKLYKIMSMCLGENFKFLTEALTKRVKILLRYDGKFLKGAQVHCASCSVPRPTLGWGISEVCTVAAAQRKGVLVCCTTRICLCEVYRVAHESRMNAC